jgi:hypothetical protein
MRNTETDVQYKFLVGLSHEVSLIQAAADRSVMLLLNEMFHKNYCVHSITDALLYPPHPPASFTPRVITC